MDDAREKAAELAQRVVELNALRRMAQICWQNRGLLQLTPEDIEQALIAWIAVGSPKEAEAASDTLAAIRAAASQQAHFDSLLDGGPSGNAQSN